ncbi:MAG: glycoside hydrolase family 99-like domain-containing protein [Chloroflexi bacterium]|nr:glycoside hydrolase family 99-like domain-containing protein [Chloroflexota bacterium]
MRKVITFLMLVILTACTAKPSTPARVPTSSPFPRTSIPPTAAPTAAPTAIPDPGEYIVIAQLNLWYFGPGCYGGFEAGDCSGKRTTPFEPALGHTYFSSDPDVIRQQIDWAADNGVDAFSLEWTTPRGVGCCGSMEDNIDDAFLKAPNLDRIRWVIFYDLVLRILQTPGLNVDLSRGMDFDDPDVYNTFIADFDHFAKKYFGESHYLSIDDRPVIYIWGTWNAIGRFPEAFQEARQKAAAQGYDVYIVGDILRGDVFNEELASVYDANTNFTFLIPGISTWPQDVGQAAEIQGDVFKKWQAEIQGLKVAGRQEDVILQPGWAPQYDDRLFKAWQGQEGIYVPAMSKDQVVAMAEVARKYSEPVGSQGWKLIWINTWNNWAEATTIEPTIDQGPKYPAGNYQFDMLEIVRDIFGAETFGNSAPEYTSP